MSFIATLCTLLWTGFAKISGGYALSISFVVQTIMLFIYCFTPDERAGDCFGTSDAFAFNKLYLPSDKLIFTSIVQIGVASSTLFFGIKLSLFKCDFNITW